MLTKLLRVGCRPLKRKIMRCRQNLDNENNFSKCFELDKELKKCHELLHTLYLTTKRTDPDKIND
jgi:hypothetical protein